jgi:hypothetical protein
LVEVETEAVMSRYRVPLNQVQLDEPLIVDPIERQERRIRKKYDALGGQGFFGELASKEEGTIWTFKNGSCICYNERLYQAFAITGAIYAKWLSLGGLVWGVPSTDELTTPDGIGRFNHFNEGTASIYWTPQTGANAIGGAIHRKWAQLGWERSPLGYPMTDELPTRDGVGRYNHFSNHGSIYWTPQTGANAVWGAIRAKWESLGWEQSYLGYPASDEVDFPEGGRANEFQHGGIYWWQDTGAIDLRDVVVHYTGLYCFGETDWDQASDSDEPYVIVSVSTPQIGDTKRTGVYDDVDASEACPDSLEIYRGRPYGINIGSVLMEHDFGDPNKYKDEVQQVVMGVHAAGTAALGLIPGAGPVIAAIAGPALGTLMPSIGGAINDALNWGDDRIGESTVTLSARQLVLLAARTENSTHEGIGFKVESGLISGLGASYKTYFGIVPA